MKKTPFLGLSIIRSNIASISVFFFLSLALFGGSQGLAIERGEDWREYVVKARAETTPVRSGWDAADDMAIWVHPKYPDSSRIIGTDKRGGVYIYNLWGKSVFFRQKEKINNIDIRYNISIGKRTVDVAAGTNKGRRSIYVYEIGPNGNSLAPLSKPIRVGNTAYGFCLYQDRKEDRLYGIVTTKKGNIEQWELFEGQNGLIEGRLVRTMSVPTKNEGCVVDDERGEIYIAEERGGIWKFSASPNAKEVGEKIIPIEMIPDLAPDLEGVAIYHTRVGLSYLLVSVQSKNEVAVFNRSNNYEYLGSFKVYGDRFVDDVEHSDGIEVISTSLGREFPAGLFVIQDNDNRNSCGKRQNQNFKLVDWSEVALKSGMNLAVDPSWDPRSP